MFYVNGHGRGGIRRWRERDVLKLNDFLDVLRRTYRCFANAEEGVKHCWINGLHKNDIIGILKYCDARGDKVFQDIFSDGKARVLRAPKFRRTLQHLLHNE